MISVMVLASIGLKVLGADKVASYFVNMNFLLSGCAAAYYWKYLSPICLRLSVRSWFAVVALLIVCVGLLPDAMNIYLKALLYPPLILLLCLGTPVWEPKLRAFFQEPLLAYLGKISYSVYLWQQLATAPWQTLSPWWTVLFVLCVWVFAHFSYKYFEYPLIRMASRWSDAIKQRELVCRTDGFAK
jgi:peptidoglycan/LPS O-acetylase OafA/YrhL